MILYYCEVRLMRVVKVSPVLLVCALTLGLSGGTPGLCKSSSTAPTEFGVNKDGEFDPAVAAQQYVALSNKSFIQAQAKEKAGKLQEAEQLYRQSLAYRERVWGTADPNVVKIYEIIGRLSHKRGALAESERCYRIVLMATIKKYGQGTYEEVDVLDKLGKVYLEEKKYVDSAKEYDQICQLESRKHGPHDQRTVQAALDLAKIYLLTPETTADAIDTLKPFADASGKGGDIPLLLPVLDTYATALRKHKKVDLADKVQARADELRKASGSSQPAPTSKSKDDASAGDSASKSKDDATAGGAASSADKSAASGKEASKKEDAADTSEKKKPLK
jgi:hypothetical protein